MAASSENGTRTIRFGVFDADLRTQELRRQGTRVKLPRQSFQILQILLERPGELVTREELRNALWPEDTFVDFDHGLNNAVKRIRAVLGDSAESPRYIETLPRMGYRFIGPIATHGNGNGAYSNGNSHDSAAVVPESIPDPAALSVPVPAKVAPSKVKIARTRALAIAAVVLLLLGAAAWILRSRQNTHEQPTLTLVPFTSYPGSEVSPTFSPDGNQVAFAWNGGDKSKHFDLYVKEVGTEAPVRLTHRNAAYMGAAWSPDGRFLAVMAIDTDTGDLSLFVIPAVGGSERQLLRSPAVKSMFETTVTWTPDSQWVVLSRAENEFHAHLAMINTQTLEQRDLPLPSPRCVAAGLASFSPDGKSLALACLYTWGLNGLYVQPFPVGRARGLRDVRGEVEGLQWSRDGRSLIYALSGNLWRIGAAGGTPERLWFGQDAVSPTVAVNGNRLAYEHRINSADVWRVGLGNTSEPPSRPFPSNLTQQNAAYSPDGKRIVFESTRSGSQEIWVCNIDGSDPLQLTSFGGALTGTPRWSPDGQRIVFDSRASGQAELYVVSSGGGKPQLLRTTPGGASVPYWSHDGQWIFFAADVNGGSQVFKIPAGGGKPVQLTTKGGFVAKDAPSGKIYYTQPSGRNELWSIDPNGRNEARVPGLPEFAWPAFDVTERGIYYIDPIRGDEVIHFYDFATRKSQVAVKLPGRAQPYAAQISVSPDEKFVLYALNTQNDADIVLVEGFQ
jgi:Tol biopolymer transport system component/DNA-binding winged helix-turn-helix (wHTH) protein